MSIQETPLTHENFRRRVTAALFAEGESSENAASSYGTRMPSSRDSAVAAAAFGGASLCNGPMWRFLCEAAKVASQDSNGVVVDGGFTNSDTSEAGTSRVSPSFASF